MTLIALGGLAAAIYYGRKAAPAAVANAAQNLDPCAGFNFEQAALDATAAGAITSGATTASPYGAGAGAALGAASVVMQGCGRERFAKEIKAASKRVCAKADKILAQLGSKPKGWDKWSCDQRLAFVAGAGPLLSQAVLAGVVANTAFKATQNEVKKYASRAEAAAEKVGDKARELADDAGNAVKDGLKKVGVRI